MSDILEVIRKPRSVGVFQENNKITVLGREQELRDVFESCEQIELL